MIELIALLARQGLRASNVYRTRLHDTERSVGDLAGMTPDEISTRVLPSPLVLDTATVNEKPRGLFIWASGDFTMVHRDRFFDVGGYPEIPWNTHVDSVGLWRFLCAGAGKDTWYPNRTQVTLEHGMWHQPQVRSTDWSSPWDAIFAEWPCERRRQEGNWGHANDPRVTETVTDKI